MGVHGAVAKRPCSRQHLLLLVVAILIGSYFAAAAAAAADEQKSRNRGAGRRSRRRRAAAAVTSPPAPLMVPITILESAVDLGAVCMDGTPPAYHLHPGSGAGNNSWIVNLEVNGFYFRGQRVWDATVRHLLSIGMAAADQVLLAGCSAGGLAVILHCDQFQAFFPRSNNAAAAGGTTTTTTVKCLADAGLFLDATDVSGGRSLRSYYSDIVAMQGVGPNLPPACTARLDTASCFFPQNVIDGVNTPIFLLNAAYDAWQIQESLAPSGADPSGAWRACKSNHSACDATQMKFLQGFRDQMVASVLGGRFAGSRSNNGLFINSCFAHCQSELPATWSWSHAAGASPAIQSRGIAKSVGDWYFGRAQVKAIDCPYPCDGTCRNII